MWVLAVGATSSLPKFPNSKGVWGALKAPPAGSGAEPRPLNDFTVFGVSGQLILLHYLRGLNVPQMAAKRGYDNPRDFATLFIRVKRPTNGSKTGL